MMTYNKFSTLITSIQTVRERSRKLYALGVDMLTYDDEVFKIIELLVTEVFDENSRGWVEWFIYERVTPSGEILKARNAEGNEICYDIPSLWKEISETETPKNDIC
jgi:hypothetical protein